MALLEMTTAFESCVNSAARRLDAKVLPANGKSFIVVEPL